ncbi:MAG: hypothetical protein IKF60_01485 [Solobacterium sp.]|nr:hypothetical protein [Solobacterium sp.]
MKQSKPVKLIRHGAAVLLTAVVFAMLLGEVTKPKFYNDNYWPLDVTYQGFYEMDQDTVDVLFLGSSHAIAAFSPQELYDTCGIRSFNLGSEEQSLFVSYYWLKEALRLQHPKAVVLDLMVAYPYLETPYNCSEPSIRKAMDPMRWSPVKFEAVQELHRMDAQQTLASFLFPVIRYHARWNDLNMNDIRFWPPQRTDLKGYAVLSEDYGKEDYVPLADDSAEPASMHGRMKDYLDRITELCEREGIELILTNTPYLESSAPIHAAGAAYASEHNLTYVDFNDAQVQAELDFDFARDMADAGHANTQGAVKLTDYIGTILLNHGVQPNVDEQYETSRGYCDRQIKNANLYRIQEWNSFLAQLNLDDYLIFVTGSGADAASLWNLSASGPFTAIVDRGTAQVFDTSEQGYRWSENIRYQMSAEKTTGTIRVNDYTYERAGEGLQVVILDREKGYVIDHSVFNADGMRIQ